MQIKSFFFFFNKIVKQNKNKTKQNKKGFVCLSAYRALTPCRDWTRPETDCLQHSKEKVDFFNSRYTPEQGVGFGGGVWGRGLGGIKETERKRENITCIKFSQMNIVTHIVL